MDIWEIRLNSDECQYCKSPMKPGGSYICGHPGNNYNKECVEGLCPCDPALSQEEIVNQYNKP